MHPTPAIIIFDIGKTNKKLLLFDEAYRLLYEKSVRLNETVDEEGDPCEATDLLTAFVEEELGAVLSGKEFMVKAINYSAYGASFVYVDEEGRPVAPLYNYLKPFPPSLEEIFYKTYGPPEQFALDTASPILGNLNSGLQIYRLKYASRHLFEKAAYALHLPQYISSIVTRKLVSDITSIGCHTALWDFTKKQYHQWVLREHIEQKLATLVPSDTVFPVSVNQHSFISGIGLHDSSAALIPYLLYFSEPFVLLSTGTWCISLNPFNNNPLTTEELKQDCLCYLSFQGKPVKASRLFSGNEHEQEVEKLAARFNKSSSYYKQLPYDPEWVTKRRAAAEGYDEEACKTYDEAYHAFIWRLAKRQKKATELVIQHTGVRRLFVDGGFSQNRVYMHMLAAVMTGIEVYAASMPQATALGAALAIHSSWNKTAMPNDLIDLKYYSERIPSIDL